ncbi:PQQ-binding-like beta-propeller repeat protein [Bremerella sp. JC817]|uniref:PQQ-binding-like beta-propeller repeat protein n=1 Tax=Bremerella sp. JC817 TaxID=3231756 RepID=UPI0034578A57
MSTSRLLLAAMLLAVTTSSLSAQQWTRFRGPNGSGIAPAADIPSAPQPSDFNWKVKLPGLGHSSPSIWGNRVFLMSADPDSGLRYVVCLDAQTGKTIWQKEFAAGASHLHSKSSYASCSPAVDDMHLYVAWADDEQTILMALNHDGETSWRIDLGPWVSQHGFGTSPIVLDDKVIISLMQLGDEGKLRGRPIGKSRLVAFDRKTGERVWEVERESDVAAYSVPCLYEGKDGQKMLICNSSAHGIAGHDPETGKQLWNEKVFNMRSVSSPVVAGNLVLGSSGSGGGGNTISAVDPNGGEPKLVWKMARQASYVPTPVAYEGKLFVWYDKGIVSCLDAATGKVLGQKRIGGNYYGSPVLVGDRLFCISEEGNLVVVSADTNLEVLGETSLGEGSESTPSISDGVMYLRTYSHLMSLGGK